MGRLVLKDERMKERIHAIFTTNISIALLILLISVTYFHEMRTERPVPAKEWKMPFLQLTFQSPSFLLISDFHERRKVEYVGWENGKIKNYANNRDFFLMEFGFSEQFL